MGTVEGDRYQLAILDFHQKWEPFGGPSAAEYSSSSVLRRISFTPGTARAREVSTARTNVPSGESPVALRPQSRTHSPWPRSHVVVNIGA